MLSLIEFITGQPLSYYRITTTQLSGLPTNSPDQLHKYANEVEHCRENSNQAEFTSPSGNWRTNQSLPFHLGSRPNMFNYSEWGFIVSLSSFPNEYLLTDSTLVPRAKYLSLTTCTYLQLPVERSVMTGYSGHLFKYADWVILAQIESSQYRLSVNMSP